MGLARERFRTISPGRGGQRLPVCIQALSAISVAMVEGEEADGDVVQGAPREGDGVQVGGRDPKAAVSGDRKALVRGNPHSELSTCWALNFEIFRRGKCVTNPPELLWDLYFRKTALSRGILIRVTSYIWCGGLGVELGGGVGDDQQPNGALRRRVPPPIRVPGAYRGEDGGT